MEGDGDAKPAELRGGEGERWRGEIEGRRGVNERKREKKRERKREKKRGTDGGM